MSNTDPTKEFPVDVEKVTLVRCGLVRRLDTPESRAYWARVDRNAAEVKSWPAWKRGLGEFTVQAR